MIDFTKQYQASGFKELSEAWAFIMDHIDEVGPDPAIEIQPFWHQADLENGTPIRYFAAKVVGSVEIPGGPDA